MQHFQNIDMFFFFIKNKNNIRICKKTQPGYTIIGPGPTELRRQKARDSLGWSHARAKKQKIYCTNIQSDFRASVLYLFIRLSRKPAKAFITS